MKHPATFKGRVGRKTVMTVLSVLVLVAAFLLGIGANACKVGLNSYIDATPEGLYTLTEEFKEEVSGIEDEITITFCADPDILLGNTTTRYVYIMAREIEKAMPNVTVVTYDIEKNPTAVQAYRTTSSTVITTGHVIVSCDKRYRILKAEAFWSKNSDTGEYFAFNGEYKMATAMLSITALKTPVAYFTVGHGEKVYDPESNSVENEKQRAFYQLLLDVGLAVKTLNLETDEIPNDCVLLIMNDPERDYAIGRDEYMSLDVTTPIEKIDRYLDDVGSFMLFKSPERALPTLSEYLDEWGIAYEEGHLRAAAGSADRDYLKLDYPKSDADGVGYALFSDVAGLATAPRVVAPRAGALRSTWQEHAPYISNNVSAATSAVFYAPEGTKRYDAEGGLLPDNGPYSVARITTRVYADEVRDYYSYVFCAASAAMIESAYLDDTANANYDTLFATVRSISRTDEYASDALGGLNMNTDKYGGKHLLSTAIGTTDRHVYKDGKVDRTYYGLGGGAIVLYTVLALSPAVAVAAFGLVRCVRRKNR